jgi:hypothetical protein
MGINESLLEIKCSKCKEIIEYNLEDLKDGKLICPNCNDLIDVEKFSKTVKVQKSFLYYIPWTLIIILLLFVTTENGNLRYIKFDNDEYNSLGILMSMIIFYSLGFLLPVPFYKIFKERKRAHLLHVIWPFIIFVFFLLSKYNGIEDKSVITAYGIIKYKYGFIWNSPNGQGAITLIIGFIIVGIIYLIEKSQKEKILEEFSKQEDNASKNDDLKNLEKNNTPEK